MLVTYTYSVHMYSMSQCHSYYINFLLIISAIRHTFCLHSDTSGDNETVGIIITVVSESGELPPSEDLTGNLEQELSDVAVDFGYKVQDIERSGSVDTECNRSR